MLLNGGHVRYQGVYDSTEVFVSYRGSVVTYVVGDAPERSAFFDLNKDTCSLISLPKRAEPTLFR